MSLSSRKRTNNNHRHTTTTTSSTSITPKTSLDNDSITSSLHSSASNSSSHSMLNDNSSHQIPLPTKVSPKVTRSSTLKVLRHSSNGNIAAQSSSSSNLNNAPNTNSPSSGNHHHGTHRMPSFKALTHRLSFSKHSPQSANHNNPSILSSSLKKQQQQQQAQLDPQKKLSHLKINSRPISHKHQLSKEISKESDTSSSSSCSSGTELMVNTPTKVSTTSSTLKDEFTQTIKLPQDPLIVPTDLDKAVSHLAHETQETSVVDPPYDPEDVDSSSDSDYEAENLKREEDEKDYCEGGYHPTFVGERYGTHKQYLIVRKLGWGHFSTVWLAYDSTNSRHVAIKIVRSSKNYKEAAIDEIEILEKVKNGDSSHPGKQHIVELLDHFVHSGPNGEHICMVFEVLGENMLSLLLRYKQFQKDKTNEFKLNSDSDENTDNSHRDLTDTDMSSSVEHHLSKITDLTILKESYGGLPLTLVKQISKQLLLALDYMHRECGLIHTDLKPENVLVEISNVEKLVELLERERKSKKLEKLMKARNDRNSSAAPPTTAAATNDSSRSSSHSNKGDRSRSHSMRATPIRLSKPLTSPMETKGSVDNFFRSFSFSQRRTSSISSSHNMPSSSLNNSRAGMISNGASTVRNSIYNTTQTGSYVDGSSPIHKVHSTSSTHSVPGQTSPLMTHHNPNPLPQQLIQRANSTSSGANGNSNSNVNMIPSPLLQPQSQTISSVPALTISTSVPIPSNGLNSPQVFLKEAQTEDTIPEEEGESSSDEVEEFVDAKEAVTPFPDPILLSPTSPVTAGEPTDPSRRPSSTSQSLGAGITHNHPNQYLPSKPRRMRSLKLTPSALQQQQQHYQQHKQHDHLSSAPTLSNRRESQISNTSTLHQSASSITHEFDSLISVKIADLGNACWYNHHYTNDIQTRQYRAPETVLGGKWGCSTDLWSAACLIFELITGDYLFDPKNGSTYNKNDDHLAQIVELLQIWPNKEYLKKCKYSREFFDKSFQSFKNISKLKIWTMMEVLVEKYKIDDTDPNFSDSESNGSISSGEDECVEDAGSIDHSGFDGCNDDDNDGNNSPHPNPGKLRKHSKKRNRKVAGGLAGEISRFLLAMLQFDPKKRVDAGSMSNSDFLEGILPDEYVDREYGFTGDDIEGYTSEVRDR